MITGRGVLISVRWCAVLGHIPWEVTRWTRSTVVLRRLQEASPDDHVLCYARRYPDLYESFCSGGTCDGARLREKRKFRCGTTEFECCPRRAAEIRSTNRTSHLEIFLPFVADKHSLPWFDLREEHRRHLELSSCGNDQECENASTSLFAAKKEHVPIAHPVKRVGLVLDSAPEALWVLIASPHGTIRERQKVWCAIARRSSRHVPLCGTTAMRVQPLLVTGVGRSGSTYLARVFRDVGLNFSHDDRSSYLHVPGADGAISWPYAFSAQEFAFGTKGEYQRRCRHINKSGITDSASRAKPGPTTPGESLRASMPRTSQRSLTKHKPLAQDATRFTSVWHLVRDPLVTINLRWNSGDLNAFGALDACNCAQGPTTRYAATQSREATLRRTLRHVVQWNLFVEATATQRVALESLINDTSGELLRSLCAGDLLVKKRCPPAAAFARASAELVTTINSEHTRKEDTPVTWAQLAALDPEMTAMAQQMALRYGYLVDESERVVPHFERETKCELEVTDGRWRCWLEEKLPPLPGAAVCKECVGAPARVSWQRHQRLPQAATEPRSEDFRVAVCFWGINRALSKTIASIREMIFGPLEAAGATIDVFFHTYTIAKVTSTWANESDAAIGGVFEEHALLDSANTTDRQLVVGWSATDQKLFDEETDWALYEQYRVQYPFPVLQNLVRSLNSLRCVSLLWMARAASATHAPGGFRRAAIASSYYSHVVYVRPDLRYRTPIDIAALRALGPRQLYTPKWGCWLGGLNDRFAAGKPFAAAAFGTRLDLVRNMSVVPDARRKRGLHSESFVRTALQVAGVKPSFSEAPCGTRVRANGREWANDCKQAQYCEP